MAKFDHTWTVIKHIIDEGAPSVLYITAPHSYPPRCLVWLTGTVESLECSAVSHCSLVPGHHGVLHNGSSIARIGSARAPRALFRMIQIHVAACACAGASETPIYMPTVAPYKLPFALVSACHEPTLRHHIRVFSTRVRAPVAAIRRCSWLR